MTPEAVEQARTIGMRGDVENRLRSMALASQPYSHSHANRRAGPFILRLEGQAVTWIALLNPPRRRRPKTK